MIDDSLQNRIFVRTVVFLLQWIGPLCTGYTAYCIRHFWPDRGLNTVWRWYCAAEAVWYIFMVWYIGILQGKAKHPPARNREEREALFRKVLDEIHDPQKFLRGWFKGSQIEDIGREEVKKFVNWAFWNGEAVKEDKDEVDMYIQCMEESAGHSFAEGHGKARCLRLTVDPITMETRSLLWYALIMVADSVAFLRLRRVSFHYHRTWMTDLSVFPPRPVALAGASHTSVSKRLSYWQRPHTSKTRSPVVFLHGIGIGLLSQCDFLTELDKSLNADRPADDQVGILALEVLAVSSRLLNRIPSRDEFREELKKILDFYDWQRFVLVCHSYGSILSTHILTEEALSSRVAAVLMVDPVTILLHMPDVAFNFTVRAPVTASEWLLWYFASTDPGVANTLGRHLFWSETVLWRDRIMQLIKDNKARFTISLASEDLIVETNAVGNYLSYGVKPDPVIDIKPSHQHQMSLQSPGKDDWKREAWKGAGLDIIWWEGYDHAQCFDNQSDRARLVDVVLDYTGST